MKNRIVSFLLAVLMIVGILPLAGVFSFAEDADEENGGSDSASVEYVGADGKLATAENCKEITNDMVVLTDGWYYVDDSIDFYGSQHLRISGTVNLILCDDSTLAFTDIYKTTPGISLFYGNTLNIYCGEKGTGRIIAHGGESCAAIGGDDDTKCGELNIYGGIIYATGGELAAGIGGGEFAEGGSINIFGGKVRAIGGKFDDDRGYCAGIGGGYGAIRYMGTDRYGEDAEVNITGGYVEAEGHPAISGKVNVGKINMKMYDITEGEPGVVLEGDDCYGKDKVLVKRYLTPDENGDYHIYTKEDWVEFDVEVENGKNFKGSTVYLEKDITIGNSVGGFNSEASLDRPFCGNFNGQGHTLTIACEATFGNERGVFSHTSGGAIISDLNVKGVLEGDWSIGSIVGNASNTTVKDCVSGVTVTGHNEYTGGIVGYACNGTRFKNCIFEGTVSGNKCVGGIVGLSDSDTSFNACISLGSVSGSESVGGIVGCVSTNKSTEYVSLLLNCISCGDVDAISYAGGIIGNETGAACVMNCHVLGSVSAQNTYNSISGVSNGGSYYENCMYDVNVCSEDSNGVGTTLKDMCDTVNNYILANGKDEEGWMYLNFTDDGKPAFTSDIGIYDVTFDSVDGLNTVTVEVGYGKKVAKPKDPEMFSARFVKWTVSDGKGGKKEFDFNTLICEDTVLYAEWDISTAYLNDWYSVLPGFAKDFFTANTVNSLSDFANCIEGHEFDTLYDVFFVDMTLIAYTMRVNNASWTEEEQALHGEAMRGILRSQMIFDDYAKLVEAVETKDAAYLTMILLESYPDLVGTVDRIFNGDAGVIAEKYFEALNNAVSHDDIGLLWGKDAPTGDWKYNELTHWHESGTKGSVSDFGAHTFGTGEKVGDKTCYTCTVCGCTKYTDAPTVDTEGEIVGDLRYIGVSLTLSDKICINFYMDLPTDAVKNGTMLFTVGDRTYEAEISNNEKGYYFSCPLNALEMATVVKAKFTFGEEYKEEFSVAEYIDRILAGEYSDEMKTLARKIANYGCYAQLYLESLHENVKIGEDGYAPMFRFEKDDVDIDAVNKELAKLDAFIVPKPNEKFELYGRTVNFDSSVSLNYYVKVKEGSIEKVQCTGSERTANTEVTLYKDNIYIVSVRNISATELGEKFEVDINDGEFVINGSVLDYCRAVLNAHKGETDYDELAANAVAAFYEYYAAACDYAESDGSPYEKGHIYFSSDIANPLCVTVGTDFGMKAQMTVFENGFYTDNGFVCDMLGYGEFNVYFSVETEGSNVQLPAIKVSFEKGNLKPVRVTVIGIESGDIHLTVE